MVEKHIRHNGINPERGAGIDALVSAGVVLSHVLLSVVPRRLPEVQVVRPGVGKTLYTRPDRTDAGGRLRGRQVLERRQPRLSEWRGRPNSPRSRGGSLARQS